MIKSKDFHPSKKYIIKIHRPKGVSEKELISYMKEAMGAYCGGLPVDEPLFNMKVCAKKSSIKPVGISCNQSPCFCKCHD